ncbi:BET1 homolog [Gigantopelta aegis]|uniref:BET1 homolog n=1 Tax=Gigantopelta aegis TaxID=1735272 RepID=UPI001B8882DB|nr:BET1 homolog [Gigantopelta aegis]
MRRAHIGNEMGYRPQTQVVEEDNERLEEALTGKVKALKSLTIDIGTEVRAQNQLLTGMDDDFDTSGNLLQTTMGRLQKLTRAGHWKIWLYMILFCVFVFTVCWMIVRFR